MTKRSIQQIPHEFNALQRMVTCLPLRLTQFTSSMDDIPRNVLLRGIHPVDPGPVHPGIHRVLEIHDLGLHHAQIPARSPAFALP